MKGGKRKNLGSRQWYISPSSAKPPPCGSLCWSCPHACLLGTHLWRIKEGHRLSWRQRVSVWRSWRVLPDATYLATEIVLENTAGPTTISQPHFLPQGLAGVALPSKPNQSHSLGFFQLKTQENKALFSLIQKKKMWARSCWWPSFLPPEQTTLRERSQQAETSRRKWRKSSQLEAWSPPHPVQPPSLPSQASHLGATCHLQLLPSAKAGLSSSFAACT